MVDTCNTFTLKFQVEPCFFKKKEFVFYCLSTENSIKMQLIADFLNIFFLNRDFLKKCEF